MASECDTLTSALEKAQTKGKKVETKKVESKKDKPVGK